MPLTGLWLGRRAYGEVHDLQRELAERRKAGQLSDTVLLLEHEPVITLGRGTHPEHLLVDRAELRALGIALEDVGRGGDVTLHAPGQLVVYPILSLAPDRCDVRRYVSELTRVMQLAVADLGVAAGPFSRHVAIGVRISRWVTMHGFALNLDVDLDLYRAIVPCGIREFGVTSVKALLGSSPSPEALAERTFEYVSRVLARHATALEDRSRDPLGELPDQLSRRAKPGDFPPP
jgi:lipoyl(octanoyl) transferase